MKTTTITPKEYNVIAPLIMGEGIKPPIPQPVTGGNPPVATKPSMFTPTATINELPVPIGENLIARVPFPMTEEDFELFIGTLTLWKKKLTSAIKPKPRAAVWKNNNTDQPIVVIAEMKAAGGALYYKVEGSDAGIPASQVHFL